MKITLYVQSETATRYFSIARENLKNFLRGDSVYVLRTPFEDTNYVSKKANKRRIMKFVPDVSK